METAAVFKHNYFILKVINVRNKLSGKPTEAHTTNEFKRQLEVFIELEGKLKTVTKQENYVELTYKRQVFWFFPPTFLYVHYKVYLILVIYVRERQKKMKVFQVHYPKGLRNFTFTPFIDRKSERKKKKGW